MPETLWPESSATRKSILALPWRIKRWVVWVVASILAGSVSLEAVCRYYGLHTPVLYERTSFGFRPLPNQSIRRFGNRIRYDSLGLRSEPVNVIRDPDTLRVLLLGDSVTNGGAVTDQADTIAYRLRNFLKASARSVEVLSASSPGWATANEAGWLNRYGTLGSQHLLLVLNTYDLFQVAAPSDIVGAHPSFPEHAPLLGLQELLTRYVTARLFSKPVPFDPGAELSMASLDVTRSVLADVRWILLRARHQGAIPVVVLVESVGTSDQSEEAISQAKAALSQLLALMNTPLIETTKDIAQNGGAALFRDGLHPNAKGNEVIAHVLGQYILRMNASTR
jgi:hypothetical protein